ncbi:2-keto-4-pentenoate hydratase [Dactylosporangium siamense]|uniref:Hydratase/decarboxylase n=1 Tax=Dactylosporangium siamense TaxID=685454 RepID=A0A919PRJ2_9ACTN|nr:fumarylacetoacetate hydrolase family protein [Dactylosporangium siamense]GIG47093.1 putative hydratase/decarboxylase [Dactylosporangium siamense]
MTESAHAVAEAAVRLTDAWIRRRTVPPVRHLFAAADVAGAYAVQQVLTGWRIVDGGRVTGRKVGLTSAAVQRQLGVDQPDFGVLFEDMAVADGGTVAMGRLLQPRVEAEVAFVLAEDLDGDGLTTTRCAGAVAYAVAALEIVDSRIAGWDIGIVDTVADNASSGLYVLGGHRLALTGFAPKEVGMTMTVGGRVVSTGSGAACLGDPLEALAWLARTARDLGDPLRAGQVVLSGALGPMHTVAPGDDVRAEIGPLGTVSVRFVEGEA